jgi:hypothetical protein
VCAELVPIPNRTEVIILQHTRERAHPIGTARIALLGLARSRLFTWGHKIEHAMERIEEFRRSLPASTMLLYPDPDAPEVSAVTSPPDALLVVDGTWNTAKRMMRHAPWLLELPRVRINPSQPGQYRIRLEPSDEHLSTVEAITEALRGFEPDTERLDDLIRVFQRMIDKQEPFVVGRSQPRRRVRPRRTPRIPGELHTDDHLVVVGAEYAGSSRTYRWVAHRLATGETFDCWVAPAPEAAQLVHMGVSAADLENTVTEEEMVERWRQFARADDVRIGWSERVMRRSPGEGGIPLKRVYCGLVRQRSGHLSDVVGQLGLSLPAPVAPGRTGQRLAELVAVLAWLRDPVLPEQD